MLKDKIKNLLGGKETEGDNKKKIENLAVFVIILIVTLIVINLIWNGGKKEQTKSTEDPNKKLATSNQQDGTINTGATTQDALSVQLEDILGKIEGVGKVKVLITYSQTNQTIPMYNEDSSQKDTEEKDTGRWYEKSN